MPALDRLSAKAPLASHRKLGRFQGHTSDVNSVAFSPDGRQVLPGSVDKTARLWDATTGQELRQFPGHTDWVTSPWLC